MERELKSVTWDKYMDSDIDSVTLFFEDCANDSLFGEFETREDEKHLVVYSKRKNDEVLNWIQVVNPQEVLKNRAITLPNISVRVDGKFYSLREVLKTIVETV